MEKFLRAMQTRNPKRRLTEPDPEHAVSSLPALKRHASNSSFSSLQSPRFAGSIRDLHVDHRTQVDNDDWFGKLSRCDFMDAKEVVSHLKDSGGNGRCPFGSTPQLLATLYAESEYVSGDCECV